MRRRREPFRCKCIAAQSHNCTWLIRNYDLAYLPKRDIDIKFDVGHFGVSLENLGTFPDLGDSDFALGKTRQCRVDI